MRPIDVMYDIGTMMGRQAGVGTSIIFNGGVPENPSRPPPLWKIRKQTIAAREQALQEVLSATVDADAEQVQWPNVLVDAVSLGAPADGKRKPLVRHLLVKNLSKLAAQKKLQFPTGGIFKHKAPVGLYALFDGQSCASTPDPTAAEFCARNFHNKLIANLAELRQVAESAEEVFVKTALIKTFQDLDADVLSNSEVQGGCGAAAALLVGDMVFSAVLGRCSIVGAKVSNGELIPVNLGAGQVSLTTTEHEHLGHTAAASSEDSMAIQHPSGSMSSVVSCSLGDRMWKEAGMVTCVPDVHTMSLDNASLTRPFVLLAASSVASMLSASKIIDLANKFFLQPRATCGEIAENAQEASIATGTNLEQFTVVQACFFGGGANTSEGVDGKTGAPPAKKAKTDAASKSGTERVRLRHILVKFQEKGQAAKPVDAKGKTITRTRQEAETMLRRAMKELHKEPEDSKKKPKDYKFAEICKQFSECATAQKGGTMCGDLGWILPENLNQFGGNMKDNVDILSIGQWSDVTSSEQGLHLIQRIA